MRPAGFDHIAIAALSLEEGAAWLMDRLGVTLEPGGKHPAMGTHNMLLSLGPDEYLELIAVDPDAPAPARARWFGLDHFDGPPRLAGWVIRQNPIMAPPGTTLSQASRGDLRWQITLPDAGQMPDNGAQPMQIDWGNGAHPAELLPDRGLRLVRLTLPVASPIDDPRIAGGLFAATIQTPDGQVTL